MVPVGIIADRPTQVYMADNGLVAVLVDGTATGYVIDLASNTFGTIVDPSFYGADFVLFLDTFFVFNRPKTNQFYISLSMVNFAMLTNTAIATGSITNGGTLYVDGTYENVNLTGGSGTGATGNAVVVGGIVTTFTLGNPGINYLVGDILSVSAADLGGAGSGFTWTVNTTALSFDPLDIAAKSGSGDPIVSISTVHDELWLEGALTTEVWTGTGAADFYFQRQQGAFIDHGIAAQYSIATQDIFNFWVMQDRQGDAIIVKAANYQVAEISTPAIVADLKTYPTIADAIGYCFQQQDHAFYVIAFPSANKTWAYELNTEQWHELAWLDDNGNLNRHRGNCCMFAYGKNIIGDWQNGKLYSLDPHVFTDDGNPIPRIRTFPHFIEDGKRVNYKQFIVDMQNGTLDPSSEDNPALISLRWSDSKGATYGNPVIQTMGNGGDYLTQISYWRLGQARDRVFEISWSSPVNTALNGAFLEISQVSKS
jgi:hypothetical protein